MAKIVLDNVSVEFPIFNMKAKSLKHSLLRFSTGGNFAKTNDRHVIVRALDNISLEINHGDTVGLVGHNGAGKSTLLRLLAKIYEPTSGHVHIDGKISTMLGMSTGIDHEATGYENIIARGIIMGLSRSDIKNKIDEIAEFTELGDYLSVPIRTYSSGMFIRLAFATTLCITPEILLIDEVFGAGDAAFRQKAVAKMQELVSNSRIVVFASHNNKLLKEICNKAILLEAGKIKCFGLVGNVLSAYNAAKA